MEIEGPFPPFEPDGPDDNGKSGGNGRLRDIPLRFVLPNIITVLAICAGMTGVRLAFEGRFDDAVLMVLLAALLDGVDGRVARLVKGSSKFGAEMDSLADIVNFGVAPALVLYAFRAGRSPVARLDRRASLRHRLRPQTGALQRHDGKSRQAAMAGRLFHRRSGAGRGLPGSASRLSRLSRHRA
jgi:hypothetical protein